MPARFEVRYTHYRMAAMEKPYRPLLDASGRSSLGVEKAAHFVGLRDRWLPTGQYNNALATLEYRLRETDFLDQAEHNRVKVAIREDRDWVGRGFVV